MRLSRSHPSKKSRNSFLFDYSSKRKRTQEFDRTREYQMTKKWRKKSITKFSLHKLFPLPIGFCDKTEKQNSSCISFVFASVSPPPDRIPVVFATHFESFLVGFLNLVSPLGKH